MNLFFHNDYRIIVRALLDREKSRGRRVTLGDLAEASRVQRPYISKVLAGTAHFNADQIFEIGAFFKLERDEQDYLQLLVEFERAGSLPRQNHLRRRIEEMQSERLDMGHHTDAEIVSPQSLGEQQYYLDPVILLVHVFLGVKRYSQDLKLLAHELQISSERLSAILTTLMRLGLVTEKKGCFKLTKKHVHLSTDSAICLPHQLLLRLRSMERMQSLPPERSMRVSKTFTGAKTLDLKLRSRLLAVLKEIEQDIDPSPEEAVFQLNIDLFPWT